MTALLLIEVDAQPTVDDKLSCEKLIKKGFTEVKTQGSRLYEMVNHNHEGLVEIKNLLGSRHHTCSDVSSSSLCEFKKNSL